MRKKKGRQRGSLERRFVLFFFSSIPFSGGTVKEPGQVKVKASEKASSPHAVYMRWKPVLKFSCDSRWYLAGGQSQGQGRERGEGAGRCAESLPAEPPVEEGRTDEEARGAPKVAYGGERGEGQKLRGARRGARALVGTEQGRVGRSP
jgi:hypothetical protein